MASVTLRRSDLFPVGTTVGVYPANAQRHGQAPTAAAIASAAVDAAGLLTVTNAGIVQGTDYVAYANVGGSHNYARLRSTLDSFDYGTATGTGNTTNGSTSVTSATATTGSFRVGQRISGPGILPGTRIHDISGSTLTLTAAATATGTGVALSAEGAFTRQAKLRGRRQAVGTA